MVDPVNDALVNQTFPGEFCKVYIGSTSETLNIKGIITSR